MITFYLLFSLLFSSVTAHAEDGVGVGELVNSLFTDCPLEDIQSTVQQIVSSPEDWQKTLLAKLRVQESTDLNKYFNTGVYEHNERIVAVMLALSDYYKTNDLDPSYIDFFTMYLFFDIDDDAVIKKKVGSFSSEYKRQGKDAEFYLDMLFSALKLYLNDETIAIGGVLYEELAKYYDGNPEFIKRHFPLGIRSVYLMRGKKIINLIDDRNKSFAEIQKGKNVSEVKMLRKRDILMNVYQKKSQDTSKIINMLNAYLPEHLRSMDIRALTDNFARLIVQTKDCNIGTKEQEVLFGVDNSGGLYNYWMKFSDIEYSQSMLLLFGAFIYKSGLFNVREISRLVTTAYIQLGIIYQTDPRTDKTDIKVIEYNTGIRLNSFAVEKYNKGLEAVTLRSGSRY